MTKVFIIEDHNGLRSMLIELIQRSEGFECCGDAESAESALERFDAAHPQLALVDLSLPGMNGVAFVQEALRRNPAIHCVILSGHQSNIYVEQARAAGAKAYVAKSETFQLVEILRRVLEGDTSFRSY